MMLGIDFQEIKRYTAHLHNDADRAFFWFQHWMGLLVFIVVIRSFSQQIGLAVTLSALFILRIFWLASLVGSVGYGLTSIRKHDGSMSKAVVSVVLPISITFAGRYFKLWAFFLPDFATNSL